MAMLAGEDEPDRDHMDAMPSGRRAPSAVQRRVASVLSPIAGLLETVALRAEQPLREADTGQQRHKAVLIAFPADRGKAKAPDVELPFQTRLLDALRVQQSRRFGPTVPLVEAGSNDGHCGGPVPARPEIDDGSGAVVAHHLAAADFAQFILGHLQVFIESESRRTNSTEASTLRKLLGVTQAIPLRNRLAESSAARSADTRSPPSTW